MRSDRRCPLLVLFLAFALCLVAPALAGAQALGLYDDFSGSQIDEAKWRNLEVRVDGYVASTRKGYVGTLP